MKGETSMDNMDFWGWVKVSFFGALSLILTNYRLQFVLGGAMLVLMASDWITGTRAAKMQGIYSTEAARNGLEHKKGELVVLIVAATADIVFREAALLMPWEVPAWNFYWMTLAEVWYCFTESHSILENLVKMGVWVPQWFLAAISAVITIVDKQGDEVADLIAQDKREGIENG